MVVGYFLAGLFLAAIQAELWLCLIFYYGCNGCLLALSGRHRSENIGLMMARPDDLAKPGRATSRREMYRYPKGGYYLISVFANVGVNTAMSFLATALTNGVFGGFDCGTSYRIWRILPQAICHSVDYRLCMLWLWCDLHCYFWPLAKPIIVFESLIWWSYHNYILIGELEEIILAYQIASDSQLLIMTQPGWCSL